MPKFKVTINGQDVDIEAADADEAHDIAMQRGAATSPSSVTPETDPKGPVTQAVENVGTGLRQAAEGTAGMGGGGSSMLGGAARWGAQQANKILPQSLEMDPNQVGQGVADFADPVIKAMTPASSMANIAAALERLGLISPETSQGVTSTVAPTPQQVHQATSSVLPQGLQEATTREPRSRFDELLQLGGNFLGAGAAGRGPLSATGAVVAPTLAVGGTDVLTDAWEKEGRISPETATAIKTLVGMGAAGGGAAAGSAIERGAATRSAAAGAGASHEAVQAVYDGLVRDGHTPASARQAMQELGIDATLMDVGDNLTQLGIKSATTPGEGQTAIKRTLKGREERTGERLQEAKRNALGEPVNRETIQADLKQRKADIGEQYPEAKRNQSRLVDLQAIADELDGEIATARGGMQKSLLKVREMLKDPRVKSGDLDPTSEGAHSIRIELDNMIKKAKPGSPTAARLSYYRKQLDTELKGASPDIKSLDEQYEAASKEGRAFETGEGALKKSGEVQSPEEFKSAWDGMTEPERQQATSGASRYVDQTLGLTDRERTALKGVFGGEWNEAKLRTMIGDEKAQAFMDAMAREDTFQRTLQRVVYNSRTLEGLEQGGKQGLTEGVGSAAIGGGVGGGIKGAAAAGGTQMLRNMLTRLMSNPEQANAVKSDIGRLLVTQRPDDVFRALEIFAKNQPGKSRLPPAALAALLQRQEELGDR